eukprot:3955818-Amphidinium_carterae.2
MMNNVYCEVYRGGQLRSRRPPRLGSKIRLEHHELFHERAIFVGPISSMDPMTFSLLRRETRWDGRRFVEFPGPTDAVVLYWRNYIKQATTFPDIMSYLRKLHEHLGHASNAEMQILLRNAGASSWVLRVLKDFHCVACSSHAPPARRPRASPHQAENFNEQVQLDVVYIDLQRDDPNQPNNQLKLTITVLCIIDTFSSFCQLFVLPDVSAKSVAVCLEDWCSHYGPPRSTWSDNAFTGEEWLEVCNKWAIAPETSAAHSPWQHGKVERFNQVIRKSAQALFLQSSLSPEETIKHVASARNQVARSPSGISSSALVLGYHGHVQAGDEDFLSKEYTGDTLHTREHMESLRWRQLAKLVYLEQEARAKISRALRSQLHSSSSSSFSPGDKVILFRVANSLRPHRGRWVGPAKVMSSLGSQIYVQYAGKLYKVSPQQLRHLTADEKNIEEDLMAMNELQLDIQPAVLEGHDAVLPDFDLNVAPNAQPQASINDATGTGSTRLDPQASIDDATSTGSTRQAPQASSEPVLKKLRSEEREIPELPQNELANDDDENEEALIASHSFNPDSINSVFELEIPMSEAHMTSLISCSAQGREVFLQRLSSTAKTTHSTIIERKLTDEDRRQFMSAKQAESLNQIQMGSYVEAHRHRGEKGKSKGFQDPDLATLRTDSPTATRTSKTMFMQIALQLSWPVSSLDISTAFLSGDTFDYNGSGDDFKTSNQHKERNEHLYMIPPDDLRKGLKLQPNEYLVLLKCAYGLADAPRRWYKRLVRILCSLGFQQSEHDPCLLALYHDEHYFKHKHNIKNHSEHTNLIGLVCLHVDDLLISGSGCQWDDVMVKLKSQFQFGSDQQNKFTYTGVDIVMDTEAGIATLSQNNYSESLQELQVPRGHTDADPISNASMSLIKQTLGELQWLSSQSRPDLAADTSMLSFLGNSATMADIKRLNKTIRRARDSQIQIVLRRLPGQLHTLHWLVVQDAAYGVRASGHSQAGVLTFLTTSELTEQAQTGTVSLLDWSSIRIERVVRSSFAAETHSTLLALESLEALQAKWESLLYQRHAVEFRAHHNQQSHLVTDCKGLFTHLTHDTAAKAGQNKGSIIDLLILRNLIRSCHTTLHWVNNEHMVADAMTKPTFAGARIDLLLRLLREQRYRISYCAVSGRRERAAVNECSRKAASTDAVNE